jgi:hypothetical protein
MEVYGVGDTEVTNGFYVKLIFFIIKETSPLGLGNLGSHNTP